MPHVALFERYSSLPLEQRHKVVAELTNQSVVQGKNNPVYLQIALAQVPAKRLPMSASA